MVPAEDLEISELCEELDQLTLHLFDALEMLQAKRDVFNDLVEQGWFSLSKSRYAMGNKSVSALQYGHQMTSLVQVNTSKKEKDQMEFQLVSEDTGASGQRGENPPMLEEIGPNEQVLRRRKGPGKTEDLVQPQDVPSKPAVGVVKQDPLTWFGILVPQSLRQAQKSFQKGIQLAAEIASLQSDIEATRRQYRTLLRKKCHLLAGDKQGFP
ncbi:hypothetical protein lerEdw1_005498 [Lerista edwardsae]|nr:hypothetical protein lerEdw1_005498 [Lerista edwardsae]